MIERLHRVFIGSARSSSLHKLPVKLLLLLTTGFVMLTLAGCKGQTLGMLNPKGLIAFEERKLFFDTLALMLIVVLPVIVMSFAFAYHYQVSHRIKDYKPNWSHSYFLESLWWGIPCAIIVVLAFLTWKKTVELDPYRPIPGHVEAPLEVQAIALPWKWLFIYPQEGIATVNYLEIPVGRQVEFWITTDNVPMSSFLIPQLGGQIYAMAGMRTRLHLVANQTGIYNGMNTQFNGDGFSEMQFPVYVVEPHQMQQWVHTVQKSSNHLTDTAYGQLLNPSIGDPAKFFTKVTPNLFENTIKAYLNTFGTSHPRDSQVKFHQPTTSPEE